MNLTFLLNTAEDNINEIARELNNLRFENIIEQDSIESVISKFNELSSSIEEEIEALEDNEDMSEEEKEENKISCASHLETIANYLEGLEELENCSYDTLISEEYLDEYLEDLARDAYSNELNQLPDFISNNIDWEQATKEMKYNYSSVDLEFDGVSHTYYYN